MFENLRIAGISYEELTNRLALLGYLELQKIMLCMLTPEGEFYIDLKKDL